jgi:hypothetical protein
VSETEIEDRMVDRRPLALPEPCHFQLQIDIASLDCSDFTPGTTFTFNIDSPLHHDPYLRIPAYWNQSFSPTCPVAIDQIVGCYAFIPPTPGYEFTAAHQLRLFPLIEDFQSHESVTNHAVLQATTLLTNFFPWTTQLSIPTLNHLLARPYCYNSILQPCHYCFSESHVRVMRLGEKDPVTVNGEVGQSSVKLSDLPSYNQVGEPVFDGERH